MARIVVAHDSTGGWMVDERRNRVFGRMLEGRNGLSRSLGESNKTARIVSLLFTSINNFFYWLGLTTRRTDPIATTTSNREFP